MKASFCKYRSLITTLILTCSSPQLLASGFQLFEQDGASPGSYHAGYAALAQDASISFYNPAGIPRIKNQQVVFAGMGVVTSIKYQGGINVTTLNNNAANGVTAQGGTFGFIPALHYVAPITDYLGFGLSVTVPFGSKSNYGWSTLLRYASTQTSVAVVDVSPAIGFKITDKASLGVGFDAQRMHAEFYSVAVLGDDSDTLSKNSFADTGYGYHLGGLYEFNPHTRLGLSYHSQVVHHLSGTSLFEGTIADAIAGGPYSSTATVGLTLPPYTALSLYYQPRTRLAVMASLIYTEWSKIQSLVLNNISGIDAEGEQTQTLQIFIPENFRNTINVSVGTEYDVTDRFKVRSGIGFDQTPVRNAYRNVAMPDSNRYLIALGGHYQASKAVGLDLSWLHIFLGDASVNPPPLVMGGEIVTTVGKVKGGGDLYAAQLTWDIF